MGIVQLFRLAAAAAIMALFWASPAQAQQGQGEVFTLQPGASATVRFEGFCYQYGESFPSAVSAPSGLADENIRSALTFARAQGFTGSDQDALEVQYAIWQLQGEQDAPQGGNLARDVVNLSRTARPPAPAGATSLIDAASAGQVRVEVTEFAAVGAPAELAPGVSDNFYGRGSLLVTNTSNQELSLYMPVGTIIPSVNIEEQDLVAYSTAVEGDTGGAQAPAAQATTASTSGAVIAQATAAPTVAQATAAPTIAQATAVPTVAQATAVPTIAQATAVPTVAQATAVPTIAQATSAPIAQATSAPTTQPTNVQAAFPTPQPTVVAVGGRQPNNLPNTSGGALLPLMAVVFGTLAAGVAVLRRGLRR